MNAYAHEVEILESIKPIPVVPVLNILTTGMVADYFGGIKDYYSIYAYVHRFRNELEARGFIKFYHRDILDAGYVEIDERNQITRYALTDSDYIFSVSGAITHSGILGFTKECMPFLAEKLRKSEIARQYRKIA